MCALRYETGADSNASADVNARLAKMELRSDDYEARELASRMGISELPDIKIFRNAVPAAYQVRCLHARGLALSFARSFARSLACSRLLCSCARARLSLSLSL